MKELPKIYEPQQVEGRIYQMWMDHVCFRAEPDPDKKPFSIVMPPPNVTGQLDRKSTRLNSSHREKSRMPSSA